MSMKAELSMLRGLIFSHQKLVVIRKQLTVTATPPRKNTYNELEWHHITINRKAARRYREDKKKLSTEEREGWRTGNTLFHQFSREIKKIQDEFLRQQTEDILDKDQMRTFKVKLEDEKGTDNGGPYRELFNDIVEELESDDLSLLIPCPNRVVGGTLPNQSKFLFNPTGADHPERLDLYQSLGKLIGIAVRCKVPLALNLPAFVWKKLVSCPVDVRDLECLDQSFFKLSQLETFANNPDKFDDESFENLLRSLGVSNFTCRLSGGTEVEMQADGKARRVTKENCAEWLELVRKIRSSESDRVIDGVLLGMSKVLPRPSSLFGILTWQELELLVCGESTIEIASLQHITAYEGGFDAKSPQVVHLWEILHSFSPEQRCKFLRFVWARTRLPNAAVIESEKFTIVKLAADEFTDQRLPTASTCFFKLSFPPYSSKEILHSKLLYAMSHCDEMDLA